MSNPILSDFSEVEVGDKVWSLQHGQGVVERLDQVPDEVNVIGVRFSPSATLVWFTSEGKYDYDDLNATLFWAPVTFEVPPNPHKQPQVPAKGVAVWVRDEVEDNWTVRQSFGKLDSLGRILTACSGNSPFEIFVADAIEWNFWKLVKEGELP